MARPATLCLLLPFLSAFIFASLCPPNFKAWDFGVGIERPKRRKGQKTPAVAPLITSGDPRFNVNEKWVVAQLIVECARDNQLLVRLSLQPMSFFPLIEISLGQLNILVLLNFFIIGVLICHFYSNSWRITLSFWRSGILCSLHSLM